MFSLSRKARQFYTASALALSAGLGLLGMVPTAVKAQENGVPFERSNLGNSTFRPGAHWYKVNREIPARVVAEIEREVGSPLCKIEVTAGSWETNLKMCPADHPRMADAALGRLRKPESSWDVLGDWFIEGNWSYYFDRINLAEVITGRAAEKEEKLQAAIDLKVREYYEQYGDQIVGLPYGEAVVTVRMAPQEILRDEAAPVAAPFADTPVQVRGYAARPDQNFSAPVRKILASQDVHRDAKGRYYLQREGRQERLALSVSRNGARVVAGGAYRVTFGEKPGRLYLRDTNVPEKTTLVALRDTAPAAQPAPTRVAAAKPRVVAAAPQEIAQTEQARPAATNVAAAPVVKRDLTARAVKLSEEFASAAQVERQTGAGHTLRSVQIKLTDGRTIEVATNMRMGDGSRAAFEVLTDAAGKTRYRAIKLQSDFASVASAATALTNQVVRAAAAKPRMAAPVPNAA